MLETRLAGREWIMDGDFTIADVSLLGWVRNLIGFYGARELVEFDALKNVPAWLERGPRAPRGAARIGDSEARQLERNPT